MLSGGGTHRHWLLLLLCGGWALRMSWLQLHCQHFRTQCPVHPALLSLHTGSWRRSVHRTTYSSIHAAVAARRGRFTSGVRHAEWGLHGRQPLGFVRTEVLCLLRERKLL
jgi:hypothetical protein